MRFGYSETGYAWGVMDDVQRALADYDGDDIWRDPRPAPRNGARPISCSTNGLGGKSHHSFRVMFHPSDLRASIANCWFCRTAALSCNS